MLPFFQPCRGTNWFYYYLLEQDNFRAIILCSLVTIWALRLSLHIGIRNHGKGEDYRYQEWRADGVSFSEQGGSAPRRENSRGDREDRNSRKRKSYYEQSTSSQNVDEADAEQISRLVAQRMRYKEKRQYNEADAILKTLTNEFNVQVDDRLREWSVGGDFGKCH